MKLEYITYKTSTGECLHGYREIYDDGHTQFSDLACEPLGDVPPWRTGWHDNFDEPPQQRDQQ